MKAQDDRLPGTSPSPPRGSRRTPLVRALFGGLAVTGVIVLATMALREDDRVATLEETFPEDYVGPVWLTLGGEARVHEVRVAWGRLSHTFAHEGPAEETYFFERGTAVYGRSGPLEVTVTPATDVTFGYGPAPAGGIDIGDIAWEVEEEEAVGETRPATTDNPTASAVVNEYITYGLVIEGVGVQTEPTNESERVALVEHGDRLEAFCWIEGQEITNSNMSDPADDGAAYTSTIWYQVDTGEGRGYIADAWYSRSADTGRMDLPECAP